ncbi:MAG: discoidin domain-containing protein [Candidatus Omnitrophota bacterium]|nr:discoidin domain-containing protein [Candidatus Omnitrophota bacterium]
MLRRKSFFALAFLVFFSLGMAPKPPAADTTPPQVSITNPANNSTVSGTCYIHVSATDNKSVSRVEIYIDGALKYTYTYNPRYLDPPVIYSWNTATASNTTHALKAIAYDTSNNKGESQVVNVTVNNAVPPPPPPPAPGNGLAIVSASASSTSGSYTAVKAIDNSSATYWRGAGSFFSRPSFWWLQMDLGKACTLTQISILWHKDYGSTKYQIQGSNDAKTWAKLQIDLSSVGGKANPTQRDISLSGTYRYVRIYIEKCQNYYPIIYGVAVSGQAAPTQDVTPPTGSINIAGGAASTSSMDVNLALLAQDSESGVSEMKFSNDNSTWSAAEPYAINKAWALSAGIGTKTVYAKFKDKAGNWSAAYFDTISFPNQAPKVVTLSPSQGSGLPNNEVVFETTYSDANGWQDIQLAHILINTKVSGSTCLYGYYNQDTNRFYLRDDFDATWLGGYAPGTPNIIQNSYAILNCAATTVSATGTALTIKWAVTFKQAFTGVKNIYIWLKDDSNASSGVWANMGTWTISGLLYWAIVDEYDKPLPTQGYYYNYTGGDRGLMNSESEIAYQWDGNSSYSATALVNPGGAGWTWAGMWYSLIKVNKDNIPLDLKAIFGPYVKSEYQGEVTDIEITVNQVKSPTSNSGLCLRVELKDESGNIIGTQQFANIRSLTYPRTFIWSLPESCKKKVKLVSWILDKAKKGDAISIDKIRLRTWVPDLSKVSSQEQAFLWTFSWLMANYDPATGMVQDRSSFNNGDFENITATAKLAKIIYYAHKKGYVSLEDATAVITKIADTLINRVPRGPSGINGLWPHFTRNGGTVAIAPHDVYAGTEWSSGDTSYAALDIITALQLIGDPQAQLGPLEDFLKRIKWDGLLSNDNFIGHGYTYEGNKIPYSWGGFGMETIGVNWAYASSSGNRAAMGGQPSDNGSGFIDNVLYPVVFSGTDAWGNDWDAYRSNMADTQIGWYNVPGRNKYLANTGLFGLSAVETPEADGGYQAYGVGGKTVAVNDGNSEVLALHYAGMISDIRPGQAVKMWEALRDRTPLILQNKIFISPLNNVESMRVNKASGICTANYLKGSWNLALQAEGWAQADQRIREDLNAAVQNNALLKRGFDILKKGFDQTNLWKESIVPVASGEIVSEVKTLGSSLFIRIYGELSSNHRIYKSSDFGVNWQPVNINLSTRNLYDMDVDQGKLYISTRNGIIVSDDQGATFKWSFHFEWDACSGVDMQNGYGWAGVGNWGAMSGPIRKTPEGNWTVRRGDIPWSSMPTDSAVADPIDPYNIAYIRTIYNNYRTLDSGEHWLLCSYKNTVIYASIIDGKSVIFAQNSYSEDHGDTWKPLGIDAMAIIRDEGTGLYFAAGTSGGIYVGRPGSWLAYGLPDKKGQSLSICADKLFVVTTTGQVNRTTADITELAESLK